MSTGSDITGNGSQASPYRTVARVNALALAPGDTVYFARGDAWDEELDPPTSGTPTAPIAFRSYGAGALPNIKRGIWLNNRSYVTLKELSVASTGPSWPYVGVSSTASGAGSSTGVVVDSCAFTYVNRAVHSAGHGDAGWTITNNTIKHTGDSAIMIEGGSGITINGNTIEDAGENAALTFGKHGVYAKGPNVTITNNTFRRFAVDTAAGGAAVTLRFPNAVVEGNTIDGGGIGNTEGISWFQQDTVSGLSRIAYNKISGVSNAGIYVSPADSAGSTTESFVIANNTIQTNGGNGLDVSPTLSAKLILRNNLVTGPHTYGLMLSRKPATYEENNNLFWRTNGSEQWAYAGASYGSLSGWQLATQRGTSDLSVNPLLGTNLALQPGSAGIDAGTTTVDASIAYSPGCGGRPYWYCGVAPDRGAVEFLG